MGQVLRLLSVLTVAVTTWLIAPTAASQVRLTDITIARNVIDGRPVGAATTLAPDAGEIFVWARLDGAIEGAVIQAEWFYLGGGAPRSVAASSVTVKPGAASVNFSFALAEGRRWPLGEYRVECTTGGRAIGEARFTIATPTDVATPPVVARPADPAPRYTHPRVGYSFTPPAGWRIDDADGGDGVRLFAPGNDALIEFASGLTGVRMDPVSYAAGWQSVAVGPGKLLESKQKGGSEPLAGEKSYQAVYASQNALTKVIFVATADRMFVITATFASADFAAGALLLSRVLDTLALTPRAAVPAAPAPPAKSAPATAAPAAVPVGPANFSGYAEWRRNGELIVDGQRIVWASSAKFKGDKKAVSFGTIPLGYEVSGKGQRLPDGRIEAAELEAKPNGAALFEADVKQSMTEVESTWLSAGKAFESESNGKTRDIGRLHTSGPDVDRVRRIAARLTPGYLNPGDFRVYVVENKDWNAFAAPNGMIVVYDSLLRATDDDELSIVLAHELVHATHEHSRREFRTGMLVQLLAIGVVAGAEGIDSKKTRQVVQLAALFTAMAWRNGYSRDAEDQADRVGLRYCYEAGFDVRRGPRLWNRFAEKYGDQNAAVNFFFGNHSRSVARAKNLELEIALNYRAR